MRRYDSLPGHEEVYILRGSKNARHKDMQPRAGNDRGCISVYDKMISIHPGDSQINTPDGSVYLRYTCISVRLPLSHSPFAFALYPCVPPVVIKCISITPGSLCAPCQLPLTILSGGGDE